MKTYRIFCLPSHTFKDRVSGVDYLRIIQPMRMLDGFTDGKVTFKVTVFDPATDDSFDWRDVFEEYDAVYFNYTTNDVGYAVMGTLAQKYKKKLICDVDDDLFSIMQDNSAYEVFKEGAWGREVVKAVLGDVHHVTCTNKHLKNSLIHNTTKGSKDITILPNYINLDLYNYKCKFKDRGYYKAIHFGSSSHFNSFYSPPFLDAMDRIMKEYPNFTFLTIGAFIPEFRRRWGIRYEQGFGDSDLMKWIKKMPEYMDDADFVLVPLVNNVYNRSKSNIKRWEASSYALPFIGQRIRQYNEVVDHGVDGLLCSTEEEWYSSIKLMLDDKSKRQEIGENGYKRTVREGQMKDHISEYAECFRQILDGKAGV